MAWQPMKISSISSQSVFLTTANGFSEEYLINGVDYTGYKLGDKLEADIEGGKVLAIRRTGDETKTATGDIITLTASGIQLEGMPVLFINNTSLPEGLKIGSHVEIQYTGQLLTNLVVVPRPEKAPESKTGSGKITVLTVNPPHLEYEYSYTPPGKEKMTNICKFTQFADKAKALLSQFKVGDWVTVRYHYTKEGFFCECIEKKTFPPRGGVIDPKVALEAAWIPVIGQIVIYCDEHQIPDEKLKELVKKSKTLVRFAMEDQGVRT